MSFIAQNCRRISGRPRTAVVALGFAALTLVACGDGAGEADVQQVAGDVSAAGAAPAAAATLSFQSFQDDIGARGTTENRALIRSANGYQRFFGHAPPADVDFSREWVMFYAAGTKATGGFQAGFLALLRSGRTLIAVTQLTSPGVGCATDQATSRPYALIKFALQSGTSAQFFKQDRAGDCTTNLCAAVSCLAGSDCDPATGQCLPLKVICGGIAGLACPGMGQCADDPSDSCDPSAGGADCSGICSCVETVACTNTSHFDSSPSICACVANTPTQCPPVCEIYCEHGNVPDANGCPTCTCNPPPSSACATVLCAANAHCDRGKCVVDAVTCGGIAGRPCPGSGKCADDPTDTCDPTQGGADCGGVCSCVQNVLCTMDHTFDSSPAVCACVPSPAACAPDACTGPGPKAASIVCADGSIAGPACVRQAAGTCEWTVTSCPAGV